MGIKMAQGCRCEVQRKVTRHPSALGRGVECREVAGEMVDAPYEPLGVCGRGSREVGRGWDDWLGCAANSPRRSV